MKKVQGRLILLILIAVFSVIFSLPSIPTLYAPLPDWVKTVLSDRGLSLGLDLQGGIHLVLEVEEDRAVEIAVDRSKRALKELFAEKEMTVEDVDREDSTKLVITFSGDEIKDQIITVINDTYPNFSNVRSTETTLVYELRESEVDRIKNSAINQALETIS